MKETRFPLYRRLAGPRGWYIKYQYLSLLIYTVSRDSVVEIETARVSNSGRSKKCLSSPKRPYRLWGQPASYYNCTGVHSRGKSDRGVMTTHLHLVPRLRMSGAIPVLQLYAFMTCIKTTSTFFAHELWQSHYFTQSLKSIISHAAL